MAPDEPEPVQDEGPGDYTPTEEEKKAVMRVHRAVGHPQDRGVYPVPSGRPSERRDRPVGIKELQM